MVPAGKPRKFFISHIIKCAISSRSWLVAPASWPSLPVTLTLLKIQYSNLCQLFQPRLWADRSFWHCLFNIKDSHCVTSKGSIDFWVRVQPLYVLLWKSLLFAIANDMPAGLNLPTFIAIIQSIIFVSELMWFKYDAFA